MKSEKKGGGEESKFIEEYTPLNSCQNKVILSLNSLNFLYIFLP